MKLFYTAALLLPMTMRANVQCGDAVSGVVNLTADLVCQNKTGLIVAADNTTINLNGFTISCLSNGLAGTCQKTPGLNGVPQPAANPIGIASMGRSNLTIQGPGAISGFSTGIRIEGGGNHKITGVNVDGPAQTDAATNRRLLTPGILMIGMACPVTTRTSALLMNNTIENQSIGVFLQNSACVAVSSNTIQDNNSSYGDSHGIKLANSSRNMISSNSLTRNGSNRMLSNGTYPDSGINVLSGANGGDSSNNRIFRNNVTSNCGDGIAAVVGANNNIMELNTVRFNGAGPVGQCLAVVPGTFFDLSERNAGFGNNWNPNNACRTNSVTIPSGVCGPLE